MTGSNKSYGSPACGTSAHQRRCLSRATARTRHARHHTNRHLHLPLYGPRPILSPARGKERPPPRRGRWWVRGQTQRQGELERIAECEGFAAEGWGQVRGDDGFVRVWGRVVSAGDGVQQLEAT